MLSIALCLGARPVKSKIFVHGLIQDEAGDLACIKTDIWLEVQGGVALCAMRPPHFKIQHQPRLDGGRRGLALSQN